MMRADGVLPVLFACATGVIGTGAAAQQAPDHQSVPPAFRAAIQANQQREQFLSSEMSQFRASARGGLELDQAAIDPRRRRLFHDASSDRLWALDDAFSPGGLVSMTPDGSVGRTVRLDLRQIPGLSDLDEGQGAPFSARRLAAASDGKAVLVAATAASEPGGTQAYRVYLVDLVSGKDELTAFKD